LGYFDPEPKTRKSDFFDAEERLEESGRGIKYSKLVIVAGLRSTVRPP